MNATAASRHAMAAKQVQRGGSPGTQTKRAVKTESAIATCLVFGCRPGKMP